MIIFIRRNEVIIMQIPSLKEAQKRTNKKVLVKDNEYILNDNLKTLGKKVINLVYVLFIHLRSSKIGFLISVQLSFLSVIFL